MQSVGSDEYNLYLNSVIDTQITENRIENGTPRGEILISVPIFRQNRTIRGLVLACFWLKFQRFLAFLATKVYISGIKYPLLGVYEVK